MGGKEMILMFFLVVLLVGLIIVLLDQRKQDRLLYYEYGAWVAELRVCAARPMYEQERDHCLRQREKLRAKGWLIGTEGR